MSGLIGSAGAKSGIIGHSEIRYETGTWTPILQANGSGGDEAGEFDISYATYTRIGNLVNLEMRILENANAPSSANTVTVKGLPFTSTENMYRPIGSAVASGYFNMTVMIDNWGNNIINFSHGTADGYYMWNQVSNNARIAFFAVYQTPDP